MSRPLAASGTPLPERVRLLSEVGANLAPLHRAMTTGSVPTSAELAALRRVGVELSGPLEASGLGGLAVHLREFVRRLDAQGAAGDVREPLVPLAALLEQAQRSVPPAAEGEAAAVTTGQRHSPVPLPPPLLQGEAASPGPPPVISPPGAAAPAPARVAQDPAAPTPPPPVEPPAPPAPAAGAPQLPRMLTMAGRLSNALPPAIGEGPPAAPAPGPGVPTPPPLLEGGAGAPVVPSGSPPLFEAIPPVRSLLPQVGSVGRAAEASTPAGPGPLSPPGGSQGAAPPSQKPAGRPQLAVKTMFGLRAFSSRERASSDPGSALVPPPLAPPGKGSLLGLRRSSGGGQPPPMPPMTADPGPAAPPPRLDHSPVGLPPLPPPTPAGRSTPAPAASGERPSDAPQINELLSGIARPRGSRHRELPRGQPAMLRNREQEGLGWRVAAIAGAVVLIVLGGLTAFILSVSRSQEDSPEVALGTADSATATEDPKSAAEELPRTRLLNENETFRALLSQVHGRGKETPELRALVDEQAALAARTLSKDKCDGPPAACEEWTKLRESILGGARERRITRRREAGSVDRVSSGWMVGLRLPEIPVENDPRVQRSFEFYTENPVGRETFQAMLFRCGAYKDMIQSTLIRHGLPADLWALVFVESGCSPHATSPVGAAGLWQFMPGTARAYHLKVQEGIIDERRSPPKSTEAAVRFLRDMRDKLEVYQKGNKVWDLVFAGYNCGPFGMVARLEQVGEEVGFWDLVDAELLPDETANYAPAIQAVALILNNLQRLKFAAVQLRSPQLTSDLQVAPGTRLGLVARAASTSVDQIRTLNLDISGETTPDVPNFAIQVPKDVVWQARDTIKELVAAKDDMDKCVPPSFDWGRQQFTPAMADACRRRLAAAAAP